MFGIENVETDVEVTKTNYSKIGGTRLQFTQKYKGIPVLYSGYLVAVDNDGAIYYVSGDYFPDVNVETKPNISSEQAVNAVRNDLTGKQIKIIEDPSLHIYISDRDKETMTYKLVYKTQAELTERNEVGAWEYIIDAQTSNIIIKNSLVLDINGTGNVYKTNPIYHNTSSETMFRLNDVTPRKLDGSNIIVYNDKASEASSQNGVFDYDPSDTHFDEVMAYYHSDEFEAWLIGLGMEGDRVSKATIYTHNLHTYYYVQMYANTLPVSRTIYLADSGTVYNGFPEWRDPAKESNVITHEYMHIVSYTYNTHLLDNDITKAMCEAYSDYFAVAYKNCQDVSSDVIGEYVTQYAPGFSYPYYLRTLDNPYIYSQIGQLGDYHDDSQILSGAFWDLRRDNDVSSTVIDQIALESLNNLDSSPTFLETRAIFITIASTMGYPQYIDDIEDAFWNHRIGDNPNPVATISGPTSIYADEYNKTWTASVYGGTPPYSYQWQRSNNGGSWQNVGTFSYYVSPCQTSNFKLKVIVTDNASREDTSDDFSVNVSIHSLSVTLFGPDTLDPEGGDPETVFWGASVDGGAIDYTYAWYAVGIPKNPPQKIARSGPYTEEIFITNNLKVYQGDIVQVIDIDNTYDFELKIYITDALNNIEQDSKTIYVGNGGPSKGGKKIIPKDYVLEQNYPNPFNPVTTIQFALPKSSPVKLVVYDIIGREVAVLVNGSLPAGYHSVQWDARNVPSGMYIYRITAGSFTQAKRMIVIK